MNVSSLSPRLSGVIDTLAVPIFILSAMAFLDARLIAQSVSKRPQVCDTPSFTGLAAASSAPDPSKVSTLTKEQRSHVKLDLIPAEERASRDRRGFPAVTAPEGTYGVEGHGVPRSVFYRSGEPMSAGELATRITSDSRYKAGMTVYLACCETGKGRRSFAQQLADTLGTEVIAPTEKLWPLQNGRFIVAPELRHHAFGSGIAESADTDRLGTMKTFKPGRRAPVMVAASRDDSPPRTTYSSRASASVASADSRQETSRKPRLNGMAKTAALLAELHGQTSYLNSKAR